MRRCKSMKLVISATDGSEGAERAVAVAAELAKSFNGKLLIVNISTYEFSSTEVGLLDRLKVTEGDALEEISRRTLTKARTVARDHGAVNIETMSGAGDPAKLIIEIARSRHADAIVVGRRGRGQLEGVLLGSVSQKLTCLAPCVVIVVP